MTVDLEGKRCVVTGASVGIGRALAIAYASRGAAVDLIARSRGALEETAQLVQAAGGSAAVHVTDLNRRRSRRGACGRALSLR